MRGSGFRGARRVEAREERRPERNQGRMRGTASRKGRNVHPRARLATTHRSFLLRSRGVDPEPGARARRLFLLVRPPDSFLLPSSLGVSRQSLASPHLALVEVAIRLVEPAGEPAAVPEPAAASLSEFSPVTRGGVSSAGRARVAAPRGASFGGSLSGVVRAFA